MKFSIIVGDEITKWEESYTKNLKNKRAVIKYCKDIVSYFNKTLRPGETKKSLRLIHILKQTIGEHQWEKINWFSEAKDGKIFDRYKCGVCGVTGKQFGLKSKITIDNEYKVKKYSNCLWKVKGGKVKESFILIRKNRNE